MSKGKHILVGKVYANWCGHCRNLKPVWKELKTFIKTKAKSLGLKVDFVEIEESQKKKMAHFKKWNPDLEVSGYPTIFKKKKGGQIEYYNGERKLDKMRDWVLDKGENHYPSMNGLRSGGESEGLSEGESEGVSEGVIGGKGRRKTKKSKSRKSKKSKTEKKRKTKREGKKRKTSKNKTISRITSLFSFGK
jgi:thiol-disulfide isomerase/thioredoxin